MRGRNGVDEDPHGLLEDAHDVGFSFVITQLVKHPRKSTGQKGHSAAVPDALTADDLRLPDLYNKHCFVGLLGDWLDLGYAGVHPAGEDVRHSAAELQRELDWAIYLALPAMMLNSLPTSRSALAHLAMLAVDRLYTVQLQFRNLWIRVRSDSEEELAQFNTFQTLAQKIAQHIGIVLEVTADLPSPALLARWRGEPVKAVLLPTSVFLTNKAGYPVLSRAHQSFVKSMIEIHAQVIIQIPDGMKTHAAQGYSEYISYLASTMMQSPISGYEDELQSPLQPLQDNLESTTYETFERDTPKYVAYRKALRSALADMPNNLPVVGQDEAKVDPYVVMVLGAGRGPLVDAALGAAVEAGRVIKVYAVEKNPSALLTLDLKNRSDWEGQDVTVIASDMRTWMPEEGEGCADIIVSELLGSFGDNELSPECLDGAQRFLKPDSGVSIPTSYTSYAAPISAFKLHASLQKMTAGNRDIEANLQTSYVVYLSNVHLLAVPQPVFTFAHPNPAITMGGAADNSRFSSLEFELDHDAVIHGFAGYFECVLYKDVVISTNPATHTPEMYSWFPIYFPIINPIMGKAGDSVEIHVWRKANSSRVWYEWAFTAPGVSVLHNAKGKCSSIGL